MTRKTTLVLCPFKFCVVIPALLLPCAASCRGRVRRQVQEKSAERAPPSANKNFHTTHVRTQSVSPNNRTTVTRHATASVSYAQSVRLPLFVLPLFLEPARSTGFCFFFFSYCLNSDILRDGLSEVVPISRTTSTRSARGTCLFIVDKLTNALRIRNIHVRAIVIDHKCYCARPNSRSLTR